MSLLMTMMLFGGGHCPFDWPCSFAIGIVVGLVGGFFVGKYFGRKGAITPGGGPMPSR